MPMDATHAARASGRFSQQLEGRSPPSRVVRLAARHTAQPRLPRLHSARNLVAFALLLGAVGRSSATAYATGRPPSGQPGGVDAAGYDVLATAPPPSMPAPLSGIANGVLAMCVARPAHCAAAVAAGALTAGVVVLRAALHDPLLPERPLPAQASAPLAATDGISSLVGSIELAPDALHAGPVQTLQDALLAALRPCGDDAACRTEALLRLLQTVPSQVLQTLLRTIDDSEPTASLLLPAADALPVPTASAIQTLACLLARIYSVDVATYQDDLEQIVAATRLHASEPPTLDAATRETHANRQRLQQIHALLLRDGHQVQVQPFPHDDTLAAGTLRQGNNLLVSLQGSAEPATATRRLLLVAHGDMTGLEQGSDGAYDNAAGVAALMHVMRQANASTMAPGSTVQLLVSDLEEHALLGSRAFVERCLQSDSCPTLVVNVDMVGRGGRSVVLSDSQPLIGSVLLGRGPGFLQAPTLGPIEASARVQLHDHFQQHGFEQQVPDNGVVVTSDNLAFQNASIPTLALMHLGADDAQAWQAIETAWSDYMKAAYSVDWERYNAHRAGRLRMPDDALQAVADAQQAGDEAWTRFIALRREWKLAATRIVHTGNDRLHRVNPRMAVEFADALLSFVRDWSTARTT